MKSFMQTLAMFLALTSCLLFTSCEKDDFAPAEATAPQSLNDVLTIEPDGSYSFALTGAELARIVDAELGADAPAGMDEKVRAFNRLALERTTPRSTEKDVLAPDIKFVTYSLSVFVKTVFDINDINSPNAWFYTGGGRGGLRPGIDEFSISTIQRRTPGTFYVMFANSDAYTSFGQGIFNRTDSSFGGLACPIIGPVQIVARASIKLSHDGTVSGSAKVTCEKKLIKQVELAQLSE